MREPSLRIGIDVSARSLKVAWLVKRRGAPPTWHYQQQVRTPDQSIEDFHRDLARSLRSLRRARFRAPLLLAAPGSYLHSLTVRVLDLKHLPEAVREQLPQLLPFDVEQAQVHFVVRRQQRVEDHLECGLTLAACEQEPLQHTLDALWNAGWPTSAVVPAGLALQKTAETLHLVGPEPMLLVNIGESCTTMVLMHEADVVYARDVALGDEHLTEALMTQVSIGEQSLSLSREQAMALKRTLGIPLTVASANPTPSQGTDAESGTAVTLPPATYAAMIQPVLEQLVSELRRTVTFGTQAGTIPLPSRVLISGEMSQLAHCDEWLSQHLGLPVQRLTCDTLLGPDGASGAIACGLALFARPPKLDLQPESSRQRGLFVRMSSVVCRVLLVLALVVWGEVGVWHLRSRTVAQQLHQLNDRWNQLQPVVTTQEAVEWHTQLGKRLVAQQGVPPDWLRQFTRDFPNAVHLTLLSVNERREVHIKGEAEERDQSPEASLSQLVQWLEQTKLCTKVQLESSRRTSEGGNLVEFALKCQKP